MTKAQIHFSNDLDVLVEILKDRLFVKGSAPFDKRLVVVPHRVLKDRILMAFAKDPEMLVAAGLQVVTLEQAYSALTGKSLPSHLELSLFLQHEVIDKIESVEVLKNYFNTVSKEERIAPFCDLLATYFLQYKTYGKPKLPSWQETLFELIPWVFPVDFRGKMSSCSLHLFGFSFLPKTYFSLFERVGGIFYFFSPCSVFWGDFFSDKEGSSMQKKIPSKQLALFKQLTEDQNPLLSNWGSVGRQLQNRVEESSVPTWEHYAPPSCGRALCQLQGAILEGKKEQPQADESIQVFSATSRLRELEILKNHLLSLFSKGEFVPSDVQVAAPDIREYAPLIQSVFTEIEVTIEGVDFEFIDKNLFAFDKLIALAENRFCAEAFLEVLPYMKGDFDVDQVRKWIQASDIRWGFSEGARLHYYKRGLIESEIYTVSKTGTWEEGLKRLVFGLGSFREGSLPLVSVTEIEAFDRLYCLTHDLAEDLAPLFDGTCWTIPTWIRYLACLMESYFPIDPTNDFYSALLKLASKTDYLDQKEVPFEGVRRVIERRERKSLSAPHLQAIRFCSLTEGCFAPSKIIGVLGLEEGTFPRREVNDSLYFEEIEKRPKQGDVDKYLFLQSLLLAKKYFFVSYLRGCDGGFETPLLVAQLLSQMKESSIVEHPASAIDPRYFCGDLQSFDTHAYELIRAAAQPNPEKFLIPSLYKSTLLTKTPIEEVAIRHLAKFARHPLRYYFHEVLGMYPESKKRKSKDYLLSPLTRSHLVMQRLCGKNIEDSLPLNLFQSHALEQIEEEVCLWKEAIGESPFNPHVVSLEVGPYLVRGTIDTATDQGWFFRAKNSLEDQVSFFPQLLLAQALGVPVTFILDGSHPEVSGSLETYIEYFSHCQEVPSLFLPKLAKSFLEEDLAKLQKGFGQIDDEIWEYLFLKDPLPDAEVVLKNWVSWIQVVFGGAFERV